MAEAVLRKHHRRVDRWMPRERKTLTRAQVRSAVRLLARLIPGYMLAFGELLGIPAGLPAAYAAAQAAAGKDARATCIGWGLALGVQAMGGLTPRWELLITLLLLLVAAPFLRERGNGWLMALTAASLIPTVAVGMLAPTAAQMVSAWACAALAMLSAPVFARALTALASRRHIVSLEERLSVGYLALMILCGGARMALLGVNIGVWGAGFAVLASAMCLGAGAGAMVGMLAGLAMALQGLPLVLSTALSMGGFLAGVAHTAERRSWTSAAFAAGAYLPLLLCHATGVGMGAGVLAAALTMMCLPRRHLAPLQGQMRRLLPNDRTPGDAYAASALTAWEQTIAAMARAVPSPRDAIEPRSAAWWESRLCEGCPEREGCGCLLTELGVGKAEAVWQCRTAPEETWQGALENLRGMGCQRLYHLLEAMNALRREDEAERRALRQAEAQRDMLVTHLQAMSGAARRFAVRSGGESWWEDGAARRIRKLLDTSATPARLSFVRRVQEHVQVALELDHITGARRQAEELCALVSAAVDAPVQVAAIDGDRVLLTEQPLYRAEVGVAAEPITGGGDCGDTAWSGLIQDGRRLVALSDGMGHGDRAALISRQTVELLRLCLDAGYSIQQTLTAVNGMLLMGGVGERFATADLLTIDLWTARATLDKLGAAPTWLLADGMLTRLAGDALPLGIIEAVESRTHALRLRPGDAIILLTDGVEDAFATAQALEDAVAAALEEPDVQDAAEAILQAALAADDGQRRDDQSAVVVRMASGRA